MNREEVIRQAIRAGVAQVRWAVILEQVCEHLFQIHRRSHLAWLRHAFQQQLLERGFRVCDLLRRQQSERAALTEPGRLFHRL